MFNGHLYWLGHDHILCWCLHREEILITMKEIHHGVGSGHFAIQIIIYKLLDAKY